MSDQAGTNGRARPGDQAGPDEPGRDQTETRRLGERLPVREAARLLGTTVEGVRSRIKRGSLDSMRVDGTVYVLLSPDQMDRARPGDRAQPVPTGRPDALVEELRDRVRSLETQLSEERTANRENRRIIAALTQRVPVVEIEAPEADQRDAREVPPAERDAPETASPRSDRGAAPEGSQEPTERRSWLVRFFFGP